MYLQRTYILLKLGMYELLKMAFEAKVSFVSIGYLSLKFKAKIARL